MPKVDQEWSRGDLALVTSLWEDGKLSYNKIGARLGRTGSSIAGMIYRLGLNRRNGGKYEPRKPAREKIKKAVTKLVKERVYKEARRLRTIPKLEKLKKVYAIDAGGIPFVDRDMQTQCACIIGDPRNTICCGKKIAHGSYCVDHARSMASKSTP